MIALYGIPNCDTVKKARVWLTAQGLAHTFHDFKKYGVPADRLAIWCEVLGWEKLLNRQGTTWRKLGAEVHSGACDAAGAQAVMLANPSVIKRPVVQWQGSSGLTSGLITVGFDAPGWLEIIHKHA